MKKIAVLLVLLMLIVGIAHGETAVDADAQSIGLAGVGNARELGGYAAEDGRLVKRGALLRQSRSSSSIDASAQKHCHKS